MVSSKAILAFILLLAFICYCRCEKKKTVDCRKYVFAPACRGVGAKRDVRHRITNEENTRHLLPEHQFRSNDQDTARRWNEKKYNEGLLQTFLRKASSSPAFFDFETRTNHLA